MEVLLMSKVYFKKEADKSEEKQKVRMSRFEEKWVVDYVDKNKDPYVSKKIFDFDKRNEVSGVVEKHVTLKFDDGTEKDVPFISYLRNRNQVWVDVEERKEIKSVKKIGKVTIKEIRGNNTFDTGREVDQIVSGVNTFFTVNLNEAGTVTVPEYIVN